MIGLQKTNMAAKMNQIAIKIENSLPQIMVVSSVVAVVLLSLTISSSHIVHHPGILSLNI